MMIADKSELRIIQDYAFKDTDLNRNGVTLPENVKISQYSFDDLVYN